jgi:hypothetical protein
MAGCSACRAHGYFMIIRNGLNVGLPVPAPVDCEPTAAASERTANADPPRYARAALRWLQRFIDDRNTGVEALKRLLRRR